MAKDDANNYVPVDYEDLYRYYIVGAGDGSSLVDRLVRKFVPYADQDEREQLRHDVFLRCLEKQVLETGGSSRSEKAKELGKPGVFDPTKANFGGVIFFVTRTICSNHLGRKKRNPITGLKAGSLVDTDPDTEEFEPGVYSLDRLFEAQEPDHDLAMDVRALMLELYTQCRMLHQNPRHKRDESLYPLLQLLSVQSDVQECGKELGVTPSTIHNWLGVLREMVTEIRGYLQKEPKTGREPKPKPLPFVDAEDVWETSFPIVDA